MMTLAWFIDWLYVFKATFKKNIAFNRENRYHLNNLQVKETCTKSSKLQKDV
jgi:hypothetical protein